MKTADLMLTVLSGKGTSVSTENRLVGRSSLRTVTEGVCGSKCLVMLKTIGSQGQSRRVRLVSKYTCG